ncbi:hypothetical protein PM082_004417 [Marasmius tenuissimus]|nr:hypothetical protein PM082_004417 [Marasmius tenuissimus]
MADTAASVIPENLAITIAHQKIVTCIDVISSTILIYDVVLNLRSEIRLIWSRKWSKITILYLVQRYLPFFDTTAVVLHRQLAEGQSEMDCSLQIYIGGCTSSNSRSLLLTAEEPPILQGAI